MLFCLNASSVVGCVDIPPLLGAAYKREGDLLVVKCNFTKDEYHLKCVKRQWIGEMYNCSAAGKRSALVAALTEV